jgi:hypothetical protein
LLLGVDHLGNAVVIDLGVTIRYPVHPVTGTVCYGRHEILGKPVYYPFEYLYNKTPTNKYNLSKF